MKKNVYETQKCGQHKCACSRPWFWPSFSFPSSHSKCFFNLNLFLILTFGILNDSVILMIFEISEIKFHNFYRIYILIFGSFEAPIDGCVLSLNTTFWFNFQLILRIVFFVYYISSLSSSPIFFTYFYKFSPQ